MRALRAAITAVTGITCLAASAHAEPTLRAGLTIGLRDDSVPDTNQVGPVAGIGWRFGALMAELDYAYLSFEDSATLSGGVHRVGALVPGPKSCSSTATRSAMATVCTARPASASGSDAGKSTPSMSRRRAVTRTKRTHRRRHRHFSNRRLGYGWLIGMRLAFAPHDPSFAALCRGNCPASESSPNGTDISVLFEASVLLGH